MKRGTIETAVGIFVIVTLACVGYLTIKLGKMEFFGGGTYELYARFDSVAGLRPGSSIEIAGVEVGRITGIELNQEQYVAVVEMSIRDDVRITEDAIASIKTSGLIGDKYIKISPGGSDIYLEPGEMIFDTEPPLDIEELVGKYIFGDVQSEGGLE
ncbi:MAG: outer membrane lipid asymmetry maintenance protein MlaD [Desulfovibrionales bacterium]